MKSTSGRNTEFIPGSHRFNLVQNGITNSEALNVWCSKQQTIKINCKPGDVCIFHGYTIHRGVELNSENNEINEINDNNENNEINEINEINDNKIDGMINEYFSADLLYAVYKKNWYNDEPEDNFVSSF